MSTFGPCKAVRRFFPSSRSSICASLALAIQLFCASPEEVAESRAPLRQSRKRWAVRRSLGPARAAPASVRRSLLASARDECAHRIVVHYATRRQSCVRLVGTERGYGCIADVAVCGRAEHLLDLSDDVAVSLLPVRKKPSWVLLLARDWVEEGIAARIGGVGELSWKSRSWKRLSELADSVRRSVSELVAQECSSEPGSAAAQCVRQSLAFFLAQRSDDATDDGSHNRDAEFHVFSPWEDSTQSSWCWLTCHRGRSRRSAAAKLSLQSAPSRFCWM